MRSEEIVREVMTLASPGMTQGVRLMTLNLLLNKLPICSFSLVRTTLAGALEDAGDLDAAITVARHVVELAHSRMSTAAQLDDNDGLIDLFASLARRYPRLDDDVAATQYTAVRAELLFRLESQSFFSIAEKLAATAEEVVTKPEVVAEKPEMVAEKPDAPLPVPAGARANLVSSLPIHTRICRALERHGVKTVEQLAGMTSKEVVAIKGFAGWALDQVRDGLKSRGLSLEDEVLPRPEDGVDIEAYEENEEEEDDDIEDREEEEEEDEEEEEAEESDLVLDRL